MILPFRTLVPWLLVLISASACASDGLLFGGQSGDDGSSNEDPKSPGDSNAGSDDEASAEDEPDQDGKPGPNEGELGASCSVLEWSGPNEPKRTHECAGAVHADGGAHWNCDCDGTSSESSLGSCEAALRDACGVELTPTYCEVELGVCWSEDEGRFVCRCAGSSDTASVAGESCEAALFRECARACDGDGATCEPAAQAFAWSCSEQPGSVAERPGTGVRSPANDAGLSQSDAAAEVVRVHQTFECDRALEAAFTPTCSSSRGDCFDWGNNAFECACPGEERIQLLFDELEHDACEQALAGHCGAAPDASTITCSERSQNGESEGQCTLTESGASDCKCSEGGSSSASGASAGGGDHEFSRAECERLLQAACPEAFE